MGFPVEVREEALVNAGRACCICHRFRGTKIECHHIVEESAGGANTLDNCIPVCFDCHADMTTYDVKHPKGTKYRPEELRRHRDRWYTRVANTGVSVVAPTYRDADISTFQAIRATLPWHPTLKWLSEHDFGGSFPASSLTSLDRLRDTADDPSNQFLDAELESARAELLGAVRAFLSSLATRIFTTDGPGETWYGLSQLWPEEQRWSAQDHLNERAQAVVDAYRALIERARSKLGVA